MILFLTLLLSIFSTVYSDNNICFQHFFGTTTPDFNLPITNLENTTYTVPNQCSECWKTFQDEYTSTNSSEDVLSLQKLMFCIPTQINPDILELNEKIEIEEEYDEMELAKDTGIQNENIEDALLEEMDIIQHLNNHTETSKLNENIQLHLNELEQTLTQLENATTSAINEVNDPNIKETFQKEETMLENESLLLHEEEELLNQQNQKDHDLHLENQELWGENTKLRETNALLQKEMDMKQVKSDIAIENLQQSLGDEGKRHETAQREWKDTQKQLETQMDLLEEENTKLKQAKERSENKDIQFRNLVFFVVFLIMVYYGYQFTKVKLKTYRSTRTFDDLEEQPLKKMNIKESEH